jgi:hypothetical protein
MNIVEFKDIALYIDAMLVMEIMSFCNIFDMDDKEIRTEFLRMLKYRYISQGFKKEDIDRVTNQLGMAFIQISKEFKNDKFRRI